MDVWLSTTDDAAGLSVAEGVVRELRGAAGLVVTGIATRVTLCGLGGREAALAMAEAAELVEVLAIRLEHDANDTYSLMVGPLRE